MMHLSDPIELNSVCPKPAHSGYELILLNKYVQGHSAVLSTRPKPCYFSLNTSHRWNGPSPLSSIPTGSSFKHAIPTDSSRPISLTGKRSIKLSANIGRRIQGGINFFKKNQPRNHRPGFVSVLIRSLLFFASKQNSFIDFIANNWSEYEKTVLGTDSGGGQGGGFTFLKGLGGGGEGHYSRNGRNSSKEWWWVLCAASFLGWAYMLGIYSGILHPPNFRFNVERLKEMSGLSGSWGLSVLFLLCIVGAMALAGFILVGSLRYLLRNLKITVFPSRRKAYNLSLANSLGAGALLSAVGLCKLLLCPLLPGAFWNKVYSGLEQLNQTVVGNAVRAAIHSMDIHSLSQKKVLALLDSVTTTSRSKGRNRRKTHHP